MAEDSFQPARPQSQYERVAEARRRFATLMKFVLVAAVLTLAGALTWFHLMGTELRPSFVGAIVVTILGSLVLAGALMGLVFFSSASGVDDSEDDES